MSSRHPAWRVIGSATAASGLTAVGGLLTGVLSARILSPADRGAVAITILVVTLTPLLAGVGSSTAFKHLIAHKSPVSLRSYARATFLLVPGQMILTTAILIGFSMSLSLDLDPLDIAIIGVPFAGFSLLAYNATDALNAVGESPRAAAVNAIGVLSTAALLGPLLLVGGSLVSVVAAYLAGFALRSLVAFAWLSQRPEAAAPARWPEVRRLLRTSPRFSGLGLGQSLAFRADQFALGIWGTPSSLGYYSVAVTPATLDRLATNSVAQVAMREEALGSVGARRSVLYHAAAVAISCLWAVVLWIGAPWLIPWLFGAEYAPAVDLVRILLLAEIALAPFFISANLIAARGHAWRSTIASVSGAIVMGVAFWPLITSFGASGAAWGVLLGYTTMSVTALLLEFSYRIRTRRSR